MVQFLRSFLNFQEIILHCFQICIEGICSPFYPDGVDIPALPDIDENDIETGKGNRNKGKEQDRDTTPNEPIKEPLDIIDGRPAWYDPIFTKVFEELTIL